MATYKERRLKALQSAMKTLNPDGSESGEVARRINKTVDAFSDYICSDNLPAAERVAPELRQAIEEHPDFVSATDSLSRAIRSARSAVEAEQAEAKAEEERKKKEAE